VPVPRALRQREVEEQAMATSVIFQERVEIPFVRSLRDFRDWALSDRFPQESRIDYLAGCIEVDMSPEDFFTHGTLKTEIVGALRQIVKRRGSGYVLSDRTRVSCPVADLSVEPDVVFVSDESLDSGRVRLIPNASQAADRYVEVEGPPDLIVEIVSDASVGKDTERLPLAYFRSGVREYWLMDARGDELVFRLFSLGRSVYEAIEPDGDGFVRSSVFETGFRLSRRRNARDRWVFDLQEKPTSV
jgi:Uma2 family endonuclease